MGSLSLPHAPPLTSLLLLSLLLLQSAGFGITLAWRTLAAESFTARFCINRATEQVPMCFGSCRMDQAAAQIVHVDKEGMSVPGLPDLPVYQPVSPWAGPQVQLIIERQPKSSPHAVPLGVAGLRTRMSVDFTTASGGLGDVSLSALIKLIDKDRRSLHATVGVSLPTGSIDERDATPRGPDNALAYPMQLGSGTVDPFVGLTALGQADRYSYGGQLRYRVRLYDNAAGYRFGSQFDYHLWMAYRAADWVSLSGRLSYQRIGDIDGTDADLNPMMMPLFDTANSGRSGITAALGVNFYVPNGALRDLRLGLEIATPLQQKVDGVQMRQAAGFTAGIQYTL